MNESEPTRMVDPERVRTKFGSIEADLRDLAKRQSVEKEEYRTDRDLQAIVERRFETAVQASIDVASHIVAEEGFREPSDYGDVFRVLEEEAILSTPIADRMVEMAGFRNALAHEYVDIDHDRFFQHLQDLDHFRGFAREVSEFIDADR